MNRQDVYQQIEEVFGLVPSFFKAIPDSSLALEWQLFRRVQFDEGPIPNKYRELIGVAISAIAKCPYCAFYHTEVAKLNGAAEAELEDAVHYAKSSAGWSTYINGLQIDLSQFKEEVRRACDHVRTTAAATPALTETLRQAVDRHDADLLISLYTDDAELRLIDRNHPPSSPQVLQGKQAIADYLRDVCGRDMKHRLEQCVLADHHLAFTEACEYPDGTRVLMNAMAELRGQQIVRETDVQAWDG